MSKKQATKRQRARDDGSSAQRTVNGRRAREQQARDDAWRLHRLGDARTPAVTDDPLRGLFVAGGGIYDLATTIAEGPHPAPATRIRSTLASDGSYQFKEGFYVRIDGKPARRRRLYLRLDEVADVLDISYDAAHALVDSRRLESHRPTREHRVPVAALDAYMRACGMAGENLQAARAHIEAILDAPDPASPDQPATPATPEQTASPGEP